MTKKDTERKQRYCLACGRPLTGRQRKWCSNDDCEGYYALHPEKKPEYIEEQQKLQRVKWAQERLDNLRDEKHKFDNDEDMKARYVRWISDAEIELGILRGDVESFHVTCSNCGESIKTNYNPDLEPTSYEGYSKTVGWFCKACKTISFPPENDNEALHYDMFRNVRLIDISGWNEHMKEVNKKLERLMQEFMVE